jgi:hypothetical protein
MPSLSTKGHGTAAIKGWGRQKQFQSFQLEMLSAWLVGHQSLWKTPCSVGTYDFCRLDNKWLSGLISICTIPAIRDDWVAISAAAFRNRIGMPRPRLEACFILNDCMIPVNEAIAPFTQEGEILKVSHRRDGRVRLSGF